MQISYFIYQYNLLNYIDKKYLLYILLRSRIVILLGVVYFMYNYL